MKIALALLLMIHGIAHTVGFASYWRLISDSDYPYDTMLFSGAIDIGDLGKRIVGVIWLLIGIAFLAAGIGTWSLASWWQTLALWTTLFSLAMCCSGWPQSKIGLFVNIGLLIVLTVGDKLGWMPSHPV